MKVTNSFLICLESVVLEHLSDPNFTVEELSQLMLLSRMQLHRKVKRATGYNTSTYIKNKRLEQSIPLLLDLNNSVAEVAYQVGFSYPNYYSICFLEKYGMTPSVYRAMKG